MKRVLSFFCLLLIATISPWWVFVGAMLLHALYFTGLELVVLGATVDAYFAHGELFIPLYTPIAASFLIVAILARPYLMFYNQED